MTWRKAPPPNKPVIPPIQMFDVLHISHWIYLLASARLQISRLPREKHDSKHHFWLPVCSITQQWILSPVNSSRSIENVEVHRNLTNYEAGWWYEKEICLNKQKKQRGVRLAERMVGERKSWKVHLLWKVCWRDSLQRRLAATWLGLS